MILNILTKNRITNKEDLTMMAKLTKVHTAGNKFMIKFNIVYQIVNGPHSSHFKSYVTFLGRSKFNILINDWKDAPKDVKESIWTYIKVLILIFIGSILLSIITNTYLLM